MDYLFDVCLDHKDHFMEQIVASGVGYLIFYTMAFAAKLF